MGCKDAGHVNYLANSGSLVNFVACKRTFERNFGT